MGSGFKNFTASVLTASDVNNYLMEQTVMSFASTGARDVAVTAPEDGMVAYIRSNDSSEGLYTYNGTSWRKGPGWNAPWGLISTASNTTTAQTFNSTTYADVTSMSVSPTLVQNRYYRITFVGLFDNPAAGASIGQLRILNNTTSTQLQQGNYSLAVGGFLAITLSVLIAPTSTTTPTIKIQAAVGGAGQQFRSYAGSTFPLQITVEDVGASGAPV